MRSIDKLTLAIQNRIEMHRSNARNAREECTIKDRLAFSLRETEARVILSLIIDAVPEPCFVCHGKKSVTGTLVDYPFGSETQECTSCDGTGLKKTVIYG